MHTERCPKCDKPFCKQNVESARAAVRLHTVRVHSPSFQARRNQALALVTSHPAGNGNIEMVPVAKIDRRTREWRATHPRNKIIDVPNSVEAEVNYCPKCGTNMRHVAIGMAMGAAK